MEAYHTPILSKNYTAYNENDMLHVVNYTRKFKCKTTQVIIVLYT